MLWVNDAEVAAPNLHNADCKTASSCSDSPVLLAQSKADTPKPGPLENLQKTSALLVNHAGFFLGLKRGPFLQLYFRG